jgi:hypothetical protein
LYIGLDEIAGQISLGNKDCFNDPENPKYKWYYQNKPKIKGDNVFLDQSPVSIFLTDTLSGVSDGGFFYYKGTYTNKDSLITINLKEIYCD